MLPVLLIAAIALVLPLVWALMTFNRFVRLRNHLRESWADIDVELKRRYELIPNLVETVKGYAQHERTLFEKVAALRNTASSNHGSPASQARDETTLMLEMKRLFAVVEAYPDLKADTQFASLQRELALTEDRIAAARRFFNGNTRELNTLRESFPSNLVAAMLSIEGGEYFELSSDAERVVPKVDL